MCVCVCVCVCVVIHLSKFDWIIEEYFIYMILLKSI